MRFYNTLTRRTEEFSPIEAGQVRMYTCGPTVYDFAHIGNFRAYVFEDLLRRHLRWRGFRVTQVMNLTDVDDKTIRGSLAQKIPLDEYTGKYKAAFFEDLRALNIEPAEFYPEATRHIPEMIALISKLFSNGCAYRSDDGSIYFSIAKFPAYGRLKNLDMAGMKPGARVAADEYEKENVADFALWKAWDEKDGDVAWDSPWGRGRPGWHIECSAMSSKYLGESFDIHTGGIDNIFPHHDNEIAQSEAASGKQFVRYWLHCAHLVVDGKKMAKSLGNFYTLRDLFNRGFSGRETRYVLMACHYRQSLNFTFHALEGARASLARIDGFRERLAAMAGQVSGQGLPDWAARARDRFTAALDDDLNTSEALAALFDMVHDGNKAIDSFADGWSTRAVADLMDDFDSVLGFLKKADDQADADVMKVVADREEARRAKNWAEADRLRKRLADLGWEVKDQPGGPKLRKR
ncbi:MAG: cysteine--tRNA ligase [Verrucomicrobia bacterium]|nr:cysteine--tRNA ligase [Verrucomicrobiota bacterium]